MALFKNREKSDMAPLITALLFCIVTAVVALVFYGPRFTTNDDVMIKALLSGDISGFPESHIVNGMFLLGFLLKSLYALNGNVPWYDLFLCLIHILAYFLVLVRVCHLSKEIQTWKRVLGVVATGVLLLVLDFQYLVLHQYTILAAVVGAVGIFWLTTLRTSKKNELIADYAVITCSIVLCLLMRQEAFLMVLPVFGLALLYQGFRSKKKSLIILFLIISVSVLAVFGAEKLAYSSDEWKAFREIHSERIQIYDYYHLPSFERAEAEYEELGYSKSDMYPLSEWDLGLFEDYNADRMEGLAELSRKYWENDNALPLTKIWAIKYIIKKLIPKIFENPLWPAAWILFLGTLLLLLVLIWKKRYKELVFSVVAFLYMMAFSGYFIYRGRFPERVSYGLYLLIIAFLAGAFFSGVNRKKPEKTPEEKNDDTGITKSGKIICRVGTTSVLIALLVIAGTRFYHTKLLLRETEERDADWTAMNEYFTEHPQNTYYLKTSSFSNYAEKMFASSTYEKNNFCRLGGWIVKSPIHEDYLKNRGGSKTWVSVRTDENAYYVENDYYGTDWIKEYYEGQGISVTVSQEDVVILPSGKEIWILAIRTVEQE